MRPDLGLAEGLYPLALETELLRTRVGHLSEEENVRKMNRRIADKSDRKRRGKMEKGITRLEKFAVIALTGRSMVRFGCDYRSYPIYSPAAFLKNETSAA